MKAPKYGVISPWRGPGSPAPVQPCVSAVAVSGPLREKLLADYVLLVPKSKLEDTLKPRAELLEKKPDARK